MKLGVVFFFAFSLSILGCSSSKQTSSANQQPWADSVQVKNPVVVSFEQTGCFGTCPIHKMVIYKDGTAFYAALRHTKQVGAFTYSFTSSEIEAMLNKAKSLQFFEAEKEYTSPITDLPTTIIYFQYGTKNHQVTAYANYPENIQELIEYLYDITQETEWAVDNIK
jgi:hypothetical protein